MSVYDILETLASEPGRNAKIKILEQHSDNHSLIVTLTAALDLTINYYIKKIPEYTPTENITMSLVEAITTLTTKIAQRSVTGHEAKSLLTTLLESVKPTDAMVIERIIARDLRCGVQRSTVNKVFKNLIPEFPYMRCNLPKKVKLGEYSWEKGAYSQLKADGMYANFNMTADGMLNIVSRSGSDFPLTEFANLSHEAMALFPPNTQTHGELLVRRNGVILPREIGNGIYNSISSGGTFAKGDEPVYMAWDQIPLSDAVPKGKSNSEYSERYNKLAAQITKSNLLSLIETRIVHSYEDALSHYFEKLAEGMEGTIIKCGTGEWKDGTSKHQCKMKLEVDSDLVITGFNPGKGKNAATFGSIIAQTSDGLLEVGISGFTDKVRKDIYNRRDELIGTIITVTSNNIQAPTSSNPLYSLFLPRFAEFRKDKFEADDLTKVKEQYDNAINNTK